MSAPTRRIVVVEDEETIREGICLALRREGHAPAPYDDGLTAWEAMERELPDLVVLDIGVPRLDGLDLCRRLRARTETLPIIFVTSREEEFDRVLGLEIGADDYLCKPFSMRELMARVKVLLRRASTSEGPRSGDEATLVVGPLALDPLRLSVAWRGSAVPLTWPTWFWGFTSERSCPTAILFGRAGFVSEAGIVSEIDAVFSRMRSWPV